MRKKSKKSKSLKIFKTFVLKKKSNLYCYLVREIITNIITDRRGQPNCNQYIVK